MNDDEVLFSRSGRTDPGGKLVARLDVPVSQETEEAVIAMATLTGMTKSEFVRHILERALFGEFNVMRRSVGAQARIGRWDQSRDAAREPV
ncbi:hypothetical protein CS062_17420 [Roseateles chitinivorans]|uniref:CopG family transcriptional regulator n=1 Tax=Roseateles chitinivorans TaxID=2917965 RepID=A0A2G9C6E0_9BURK|nr:hypothetical protein [Roseateles chitinivorans]PIM51905.1 hypothetical protein CS062_17420 [Roseateles chitinivorans]